MNAFDFAQTPLAPLLLTERSCGQHVSFGFSQRTPLQADLNAITATPGGTVLDVRGTNGVRYAVRLSGATQILRRGRMAASVADLNVGDRLRIVGQLDPTQAGYVLAQSVRDDSIVHMTSLKGTINYVNEARNLILVDLVASPAPLLVLLGPHTVITLANGHRGTIADVQRGMPVTLTGTYDLSTRILTRATALTIMARSALPPDQRAGGATKAPGATE